MRTEETAQTQSVPSERIVGLVLREARKLHRSAVSGSLADSLPVLRRLISTQVMRGLTLPELAKRRSTVQRKHVLRAIAIEAGYTDWAEYRRVLVDQSLESLQQFDVLRRMAGYPNLWFSSFEEAEIHAAENGGRAVRVGHQAVVLAEMQSVA